MPVSPSSILRVVAVAVVATVAVVFVGLLARPVAAQTPPPVTYIAPVAAPVLDPFRPPPAPYGPGNRGIEYDTVPGTGVVASASGTVVFAGPVGGRLHVTVLHADSVRTSYSYLVTIAVATNQRVVQGERVGTAGETFHFGVRIGAAYVDPASLFGGHHGGDVALVPHNTPFPSRPPRSGADAPLSTTVAWLRGAAAHLLPPNALPQPIVDIATTMTEWRARQDACTPAREGIPPPPPGRRVAILVGGLGSTSAGAAIDALDTDRLGYARGDVMRFSYSGGRVPGTGTGIADVPSRPYAAADSLGDLSVAAVRLADLVGDVADRVPGARIDLLAHSQGGVVTRLALELLTERDRHLLGRLGVVVTIGSPHLGADLATIVAWARSIPGGDAVLESVQDVIGLAIEPDSPAVAQLAEGSDLVRRLAATPVPPGVPVLSIGARGDVVVAAPRTRLPGATNVVVSVDGLITDHEHLPGGAAVTREIALARAGRPPTCEGFLEAVADSIGGAGIGWAQSGFAILPAGGAGW